MKQHKRAIAKQAAKACILCTRDSPNELGNHASTPSEVACSDWRENPGICHSDDRTSAAGRVSLGVRHVGRRGAASSLERHPSQPHPCCAGAEDIVFEHEQTVVKLTCRCDQRCHFITHPWSISPGAKLCRPSLNDLVSRIPSNLRLSSRSPPSGLCPTHSAQRPSRVACAYLTRMETTHTKHN